MNRETELPANVVELIKAGRKIQAIKAVRESQGMGLREAKEMVEAYVRENSDLQTHRRLESESGVGRLLLFAMIAVAGYIVYRVLA
jgi:hypothetical protein